MPAVELGYRNPSIRVPVPSCMAGHKALLFLAGYGGIGCGILAAVRETWLSQCARLNPLSCEVLVAIDTMPAVSEAEGVRRGGFRPDLQGNGDSMNQATAGTKAGSNAGPTIVGPLKEKDLPEAQRIIRVAFGTFFGVPEPETFWRPGTDMQCCASHVQLRGICRTLALPPSRSGTAQRLGLRATRPGVWGHV